MSDKAYMIRRFYADEAHPDNRKVIRVDLTLAEAQEHCNRDDAHDPFVWFDGYEEE